MEGTGMVPSDTRDAGEGSSRDPQGIASNWPCGLSPAALQGLPGFRGSYETAPGIMETEVLQDLRLPIREVGQLVW